MAEAAIDAGVEYARCRLQEDPKWKGNLNRVVVDTPTFYIEESQGNVIGLMRPDASVPFSQFRIRFNYYNGAPLLSLLDDGLPDPISDLRFDLGFVSVNNLDGGIRFVPRPNVWGIISEPELLKGPFQLGPGTVCLAVEGRAGNGLADTGPDQYDPPSGGRGFTKRVAEVILASEFHDGTSDAAIMAGTNLEYVLPSGAGALEIKSKKGVPRTRSKGSVIVNAGGGANPNYKSTGELLIGSSGSENVQQDSGTTVGEEGNVPFYELAWDDIHKASSDPAEAIQIPAGTYVFDDAGALHYYDKTWQQYKSDEAARVAAGQPFDPGVAVSANMANLRSDSLNANLVKLQAYKLEFRDDVKVSPSSSGVTEFALVPQRGTQADSTDTSDLTSRPGSKYAKDVELELKPLSGDSAFTAPGDVLIATKIRSSEGGSFVAEGNLRIDAGSLDKFGNVGVSFYSKKDVQVSTYEPSGNKYTKVGVDGMFYSWGDFTIRTGEPGLAASKWQPIDLEGALVAYGTENGPDVEMPGVASGVVRLTASKATFNWDPKKLGGLLDVASLSNHIRITRVSYARHL
jgi:hypothetical protein